MSRIGQSPVSIKENVEAILENKSLKLKGPKGYLEMEVSNSVDLKINDDNILIENKDNTLKGKANWGTTRALINNMVIGVTTGFTKNLEIVGVGYRGTVSGKKLTLNLGLSHTVEIEIPDDIEIKMDGNTKLAISSVNKQKLGEFCSMIRSKRPPEPFKGKGIRYADEYIIRKEGKKK
jgi:large subunit ribosomal protein L6